MFDEEDCSQEKKEFVKFDLEGANSSLWENLKPKLSNLIIKLLDTEINSKTDGSIKEETARIAANLIEYANAKLEKPSLENQKLLVEIENLLAAKAKVNAETRKINAEAEQIEIDNTLKKLKAAIGLAKIISPQLNDPDSIAFIKNIEELAFVFQSNRFIE